MDAMLLKKYNQRKQRLLSLVLNSHSGAKCLCQ